MNDLPAPQNRLLLALAAEDLQPLNARLAPVTLEKGALLYDPGNIVDTVYFPDDCVISLMTLMESCAAIESPTIGRAGALDLMSSVSPRQSLSRAIVQVAGRARRIGAAHLHRAWEAGEAADLVFSDMVMPGRMDGVTLAQEIRRRWPGLPVVLNSGFSEAADAASREGWRLLAKTYRIDALAAELASARAEAKP